MQFALALFLLLFIPGVAPAASPAGQSIEGRLVFGDAWSGCNLCTVSLVSVSGSTVNTVYPDVDGHFRFRYVQPGLYRVRAAIDGYEEAEERVEVSDNGWTGTVRVMMNRKPKMAKQVSGPHVVNVSEFRERYPKKAVDAFKKGLENRKKGKNDKALTLLEEAVRLAPDFYEAHNELGLAYKATGRLNDAEREFLRAHELNGSSADPLIYLSALYIDENQPERAVAASEEAVKTNSRSAPAFISLGIALYKAARLDRAEAALKKALDLGPKMAQVRLMLANVYLKLHRYDNVLEQLDGYLAENPLGDQHQTVEKMRQALLDAIQKESR